MLSRIYSSQLQNTPAKGEVTPVASSHLYAEGGHAGVSAPHAGHRCWPLRRAPMGVRCLSWPGRSRVVIKDSVIPTPGKRGCLLQAPASQRSFLVSVWKWTKAICPPGQTFCSLRSVTVVNMSCRRMAHGEGPWTPVTNMMPSLSSGISPSLPFEPCSLVCLFIHLQNISILDLFLAVIFLAYLVVTIIPPSQVPLRLTYNANKTRKPHKTKEMRDVFKAISF